MSAAAAAHQTRAPDACLQCGLPVRRRVREGGELFCCFGCSLIHQITGSTGEEAQARLALARFMLAAFLAMAMMMFSTLLYAEAWFPEAGGSALGPLAPAFRWIAAAFAAPLIPLLGWPIVRGFFRGNASAVDALILAGSLAAYLVSLVHLFRGRGEVYVESGAMVLLLFTLGRYLEARARIRAAQGAGSLLELSPATARRVRRAVVPSGNFSGGLSGGRGASGGAEEEEVPLAEVRAGDLLRVLPGERFPADGVVVSGRSLVDSALVTGESAARSCGPGDPVHAGAGNLDGALEVRVTAARGERWIDRAAALIEEARRRKGSLERASDRVSRAFLPAACAVAAATFLYWRPLEGSLPALLHALAVLLAACPCALGIATPLAAWTAIGLAARQGILVRGGEALEALARGGTMVFDKTGTLTGPVPEVGEVLPAPGSSEPEVLRIAGALARSSLHPASLAIAAEAKRRGINGAAASGARVHPGLGVSGTVDGSPAVMGSPRFLAGAGAALATADAPGAGADEAIGGADGAGGQVLVSRGGRLAGAISLRESVRPEAREALAALARLGFRSEVLTGDHPERGAALGETLGVPVRAGLLPLGKVARIEDLSRAGGVVAMVGDGINDTAALAASTVGIAMGSGVDLAREAADVILLGGPGGPSLEALPRLVELSRRTLRRIRWNLFWAFSYNTVAMALGAMGLLGPASAAAIMVGSSVFVVGGSLAGGENWRSKVGSRKSEVGS